MQYDSKRKYYYLNENEAQELSGYQDLTRAGIDKNRLKKHGKLLMSWLTDNMYNEEHPKRKKPRDWVLYRIHKNSNNEKALIEDMLVELIEWDYDVDGTRKIYEDGSSYNDIMPFTVKSMGYKSGLKFDGDIIYEVPEDEYEVDY